MAGDLVEHVHLVSTASEGAVLVANQRISYSPNLALSLWIHHAISHLRLVFNQLLLVAADVFHDGALFDVQDPGYAVKQTRWRLVVHHLVQLGQLKSELFSFAEARCRIELAHLDILLV